MIGNRILCVFFLLEKLRIGFVLNEKENGLCLNFAFQFSQNSPPHANSSNKIIGISNSTVITSYTVVHTLVIFFIFVCCPIMCLFVLCSVFWYDFRKKKRCSFGLYLQLFVGGLMSYLRYLCLFGSSLPPVVCRRSHVLFTLFVFVRFVFTSSCL